MIVVARYNALYIRQSAIANFNCVTVEYFVQRTCRWDVFIERLQEIPIRPFFLRKLLPNLQNLAKMRAKLKYICKKFINHHKFKKCLLFRCRHAVVIMQTLNWTNQ